MKILVVNAGSSSLKFQLFDMTDESVMIKGNCERIGNGGHVKGKVADGRKFGFDVDLPDHTTAFKEVQKLLCDSEFAVISSMSEISAVGHRIVQGGALFDKSCIVDQKVIDGIESLIDLAPLHNAAHLQGIRACLDVLGPDVPEVTVFDNCFHLTMPPEAYLFAVPYEYYEKYKIRRYGFHGTSHRYVSQRYAEFAGVSLEGKKLITCHLGNGSSITAIKDGKVIDTSMGLTPLDGFMMGTRSGGVDPSVVTYIAKKENMTPDEMSIMLNKKSGVLGLTGIDDDREIQAACEKGDERAMLCRRMHSYQIRKFIGSYAAALEGVDAIIFTGGLGENAEDLRWMILEHLEWLGVKVDKAVNDATIHGAEGRISTADSKVDVCVLPTNEELMIARDTKKLVEG